MTQVPSFQPAAEGKAPKAITRSRLAVRIAPSHPPAQGKKLAC